MLEIIRQIPGFESVQSITFATERVKFDWNKFKPEQKVALYTLACKVSESIDDLDLDNFIDEVFSKWEQEHPEYQKTLKKALRDVLSPLSQFSDDELQQELEKRSQSKTQRPQPLEVNAEEAIFILRRLVNYPHLIPRWGLEGIILELND